jgi:hypothetical protein
MERRPRITPGRLDVSSKACQGQLNASLNGITVTNPPGVVAVTLKLAVLPAVHGFGNVLEMLKVWK